MRKIKVGESEINVVIVNAEDYISLTDMVRGVENGLALIEKWLRNKNTIEFLGIWDEMYNPDFNSPEFGGILSEAGTNRFLLSVKQWVERTNSRGIPQPQRLKRLNEIAIHQMRVLSEVGGRNLLQ